MKEQACWNSSRFKKHTGTGNKSMPTTLWQSAHAVVPTCALRRTPEGRCSLPGRWHACAAFHSCRKGAARKPAKDVHALNLGQTGKYKRGNLSPTKLGVHDRPDNHHAVHVAVLEVSDLRGGTWGGQLGQHSTKVPPWQVPACESAALPSKHPSQSRSDKAAMWCAGPQATTHLLPAL